MNRLFWGLVILVVGIVLLLMNLGLIAGNFWWVLWPLLLIFAGIWFLIGPMFNRREVQQYSLPLEDILEAEVSLQHGAGKLNIDGQALPDQLLQGTFVGGVKSDFHRQGTGARLQLQIPSDVFFGFPWFNFQGFDWRIAFNSAIPLRLRLSTGAGESWVDLSAMRVPELRLETGASATHLTLPAAGVTHAEIKAGAASLDLRIPASTAARIQVKSGLSGVNVDTRRFPRNGEFYESLDYNIAQNRAEVLVEAGVGSVDIR